MELQIKVKVKVSVHAMKTNKGSTGLTPLIHNLRPGWREVCLMPQLLYPLGKSPRYTLNRRHRIEAIIFKTTEAHYLRYGRVF
jgi:hypothetical protein